MLGILRAARYAFGPNRLHLCGPNANEELLFYLLESDLAKRLDILLRQFQTMFPYLRAIAEANGIVDLFDDRVVEAYWLGNKLLENVSQRNFYRHLEDGLKLKKSLSPQDFAEAAGKIGAGAKMHHSFHVFNIWHSKNLADPKILAEIDSCRVSWGKITAINGPAIEVKTQPLAINARGDLTLGKLTTKKIYRKLSDDDMLEAKIGDTISLHWDVPCEILTPRQVKNLKKYTRQSLKLANSTLV